MPYSTIDKPNLHFTAYLRNGVYAVSGTTNFDIGFQPDLSIMKVRSTTGANDWTDAVRGANKQIKSNSDAVEQSVSAVTAFLSNGFTITNENDWGSGDTVVHWLFKANGAGSSNTNGTITSTASANTTSGFSIVSYTGNGTSGATVGHGLGVAPKMIIIKNRTRVDAWPVDARQVSGIFYLNETGTKGSYGSIEPFVSTAPTSTVFSLGSAPNTNNSGSSLIAYCFAEVKGFSKFGFYLGNGNADGRFVYTGFKPAFLLIKRNVSATNWQLFDNKRDPYNVMYKILSPNNTNAEATADPTVTNVNFLSNGFKLPTTWNGVNGLDSTYVYMCFAENPFVSSKSIPTTAR